MVNTTQQIHLVFSSFSLQNENNTDALYVYDGENSTAVVLGAFYGDHRPPQEGMYSSSNRMFVIFKSDETDSYKGFSASYYAVNKSGKFCQLLHFEILTGPEVSRYLISMV